MHPTTLALEPERPGRLLRLALDVVQHCNLRCRYCHPGLVWEHGLLGLDSIREVFIAAEQRQVLEVVLTGGEICLHPDFQSILESLELLNRTSSVMVTNGTRLNDERLRAIRSSSLTRVCLSIDSIDPVIHAEQRGDNLHKVLDALGRLQATGKPITVISVVCRSNLQSVLELSNYLAEHQLAQQHHLCAPSYSGVARDNYPAIRLRLSDYYELQGKLDDSFQELATKGLRVSFNSFWPATGVVGGCEIPRVRTLQHVSEQVKNTLAHVRTDGHVKLALAAWGRETVGDASIGCLTDMTAGELLDRANLICSRPDSVQMKREVEARHKFQVGPLADQSETDRLIDSVEVELGRQPGTVPVVPLEASHIMREKFDDEMLVNEICEWSDVRAIRHGPVVVVYDRVTSTVAALTLAEFSVLPSMMEEMDSCGTLG